MKITKSLIIEVDPADIDNLKSSVKAIVHHLTKPGFGDAVLNSEQLEIIKKLNDAIK